MADDDGLQQHPVEEIVNVHWGEGLAVEFFTGADGGDASESTPPNIVPAP